MVIIVLMTSLATHIVAFLWYRRNVEYIETSLVTGSADNNLSFDLSYPSSYKSLHIGGHHKLHLIMFQLLRMGIVDDVPPRLEGVLCCFSSGNLLASP
jgi:hypothetical protein